MVSTKFKDFSENRGEKKKKKLPEAFPTPLNNLPTSLLLCSAFFPGTLHGFSCCLQRPALHLYSRSHPSHLLSDIAACPLL